MDAMSSLIKTPLPYFLVLTLFACAPKPKPPTVRFYERLHESLERLDLTSVSGKRIVIDPGHGGTFRGARGLGGLDEADVNLGVALYLWGLLDEAGAEVFLTRKTDKDFVDGDSNRLSADLQARVDIVTSVRPDVFISLHHNAHFEGDRGFNEIQIYHKIGDHGPSLDLARIVARHLRGNIGEAKTKVLAGNYYVLRNSPVTSVLSEPSFISNPEIESKLKLADKQRLEAEVYFLALADYFSRGIPRVLNLLPTGRIEIATPRIEVTFDELSLIDLTSVHIHVDDVNLEPFKVAPNTFSAFPPAPLRSGKHTLRASARSIGGNSSAEATSVFEVDVKPEVLTVSVRPTAAASPYPQEITALVLDGNGNPVRDSTSVGFSWSGGNAARQTSGGRASVFAGKDIPFHVQQMLVTCSGLDEDLHLGRVPLAGYVSGFVMGEDGSPLVNAAITSRQSAASTLSNMEGYFALEPFEGSGVLEISRSGFKKACVEVNAETYPVIGLERFYASLEHPVVITLDAVGGGEETGWVGPTGVTASDLNLELCVRLAGLLSSVGIDVFMTREADHKVGGEQRVVTCESHGSHLLISLCHAEVKEEEAAIGHFPGSSGGMRLSNDLADEINERVGYRTRVTEIADYLIQQTSCPAVKVTFPVLGTVQDELKLSQALNVWNKAYAVLCGTLRYLGVDGTKTFSISGQVLREGDPHANALVVIDGSLETLSDEEGLFFLKLLEPGRHTAEAFTGALRSEAVTFDQSSGPILLDLK
jgi:N-acetylmuramoyl-L-alanine amidase